MSSKRSGAPEFQVAKTTLEPFLPLTRAKEGIGDTLGRFEGGGGRVACALLQQKELDDAHALDSLTIWRRWTHPTPEKESSSGFWLE
jgi:hypothetical protein